METRAFLSARPIRTVVVLAQQYERHLSALSMIGGYAFDSYTFGRIDHASTHVVFLAYLVIAGGAIAISHRLESRGLENQPSQRVRTILTAATQFALGCLLSGFCVFYLRSASLWSSWPYLLVLVGIFIGNEFFKVYTTRFSFSLLLYFFALFSYAILLVPVLTATLGVIPFLISGGSAIAIFWVYNTLLARIGYERYRQVRLQVLAGTLAIYALVNVFYFLKVLPPLPLALADTGVYHSIKRVGASYLAGDEPQPWTTLLGVPPVYHVALNQRLYVYSAVFAPVGVSGVILHSWEWYDAAARHWTPQTELAFSISGGREGGYRVYSFKSKLRAGAWRVNIKTEDGRPLGRIRFAVAAEHLSVPLSFVTLH